MNSSASFPVSLLVTVLTLVLVLVIAWFAVRSLTRLSGGQAGQRRLRILQNLAIGSRERLLLVRFDGADYLLGVTSGGVSMIDSKRIDAEGQSDES